MSNKILIVDDEEDIREILQFNLENSGYKVVCAASGEEALIKVDDSVDLILLDIMMAGMSGYAVAERIRKEFKSNLPIIFLTARSDENSIITGFSAGGDDYISKPFSIQEVLARVKAVLRRSQPAQTHVGEAITINGLTVDNSTKNVRVDSVPVKFSKKEFEILWLLISHPGKLYSRESIIDVLWKDTPYVVDRTIDVHIARIRSKIGSYKSMIINKPGYGYTFIAKD